MKKITLIVVIVMLCMYNFGYAQQQWTPVTGLPTASGSKARAYAASFSLGSNGMVVGGQTINAGGGATIDPSALLNDAWMYDSFSDTWSQKAQLPGPGRAYAASMTKFTSPYYYYGYVATGIIANTVAGVYTVTGSQDVYQYSASTNTWSTLPFVPGGPRFGSVGISAAGQLLVGGGITVAGVASLSTYGAAVQDFYKYDSFTYLGITYYFWTRVSDLPFGKRAYMASFTTEPYAYVGLGINNTSNTPTDFWKYTPAGVVGMNESWTQVKNYPGSGRNFATCLSVQSTGIVGGSTGGGDFYQYTPSVNDWCKIQDMPANTGRVGTSAFSLSNKGYVGAGFLPGSNVFYSDFFKFDPNVQLTLAPTKKAFCQGEIFNVTITTGCVYSVTSSIYTVELSDASGSFAVPTVVGTFTTQASGNIIIPATVPGSALGYSYALRVRGSAPIVYSGTSSPITVSSTSAIATAPGTIAGNNQLCTGQTRVYSIATVAGLNYQWILSNANAAFVLTTPGAVTVSGTTGGTLNLQVRSYNACGYSPYSTLPLTVTGTPQTLTISGVTSLCQNTSSVYSVTTSVGISYNWTVSSNGTITGSAGNTKTILGLNAGVFTITVIASNFCNLSSIKTMNVSVLTVPSAPTTISGPNGICQGSTATYTTGGSIGLQRYYWSVNPNATITGNIGTVYEIASVKGVSPGIANISTRAYSSNGCYSPYYTKNVSIDVFTGNPTTPTISGSSLLGVYGISKTIYTVTSLPGTVYTWSFAGINASLSYAGNNATLTGLSVGSGTLVVYASKGACASLASSSKIINIKKSFGGSLVTTCAGTLEFYMNDQASVFTVTGYLGSVPGIIDLRTPSITYNGDYSIDLNNASVTLDGIYFWGGKFNFTFKNGSVTLAPGTVLYVASPNIGAGVWNTVGLLFENCTFNMNGATIQGLPCDEFRAWDFNGLKFDEKSLNVNIIGSTIKDANIGVGMYYNDVYYAAPRTLQILSSFIYSDGMAFEFRNSGSQSHTMYIIGNRFEKYHGTDVPFDAQKEFSGILINDNLYPGSFVKIGGNKIYKYNSGVYFNGGGNAIVECNNFDNTTTVSGAAGLYLNGVTLNDMITYDNRPVGNKFINYNLSNGGTALYGNTGSALNYYYNQAQEGLLNAIGPISIFNIPALANCSANYNAGNGRMAQVDEAEIIAAVEDSLQQRLGTVAQQKAKVEKLKSHYVADLSALADYTSTLVNCNREAYISLSAWLMTQYKAQGNLEKAHSLRTSLQNLTPADREALAWVKLFDTDTKVSTVIKQGGKITDADSLAYIGLVNSGTIVSKTALSRLQNYTRGGKGKAIVSYTPDYSKIGCDAAKARKDAMKSSAGGSLGIAVPNPALTETSINYAMSEPQGNAALQIADITTGKIVKQVVLDKQQGIVTLSVEKLPAGVYSYSLVANGTIFATQKLVVIK